MENILKDAVREGLRLLSGKDEPEDDLSLYERLRPSDFAVLIRRFGSDVVLSYIRDMERKRKI